MQPESQARVAPGAARAEAILRNLSERIGSKRFKQWFTGQVQLAVDTDATSVVIGVPRHFQLKWLQQSFQADLLASARAVLGPQASVQFEVAAPQAPQTAEPAPTLQLAKTDGAEPARAEEVSVKPGLALAAPEKVSASPANVTAIPSVLRVVREPSTVAQAVPQQTRRGLELQDLVLGNCNEMALAAVKQVCLSPVGQLSTLFLHGPVGTGKTHLLEGLARQLRRSFPQLQVLQMTAETFTNLFSQALGEKKAPGFRNRFRSVDVFIVDDVGFLDGKRVMQGEFLHTVQYLERQGKLLVAAADRHPRLLTRISDELRSRLQAGLICRLEVPDVTTRREIVQCKAQLLGTAFSPEVEQFLAEKFRNNVRELEGAVQTLHAWQQYHTRKCTLTAARQVLADIERDCTRVIRLPDIEQVICEAFRITPEDLKSNRRLKSLQEPRMVAMFLARKHTRAAYTEIGTYFGGRNHSTVMAAERKMADTLAAGSHLDQSRRLNEMLEALEQQLLAG